MQVFPKPVKGEFKVTVGVPEAALVMVVVYVWVVMPSCAVTTVVITFEPTFREMGAEAAPLVTEVALTVMVAAASVAVGVTVMLLVTLATDAV